MYQAYYTLPPITYEVNIGKLFCNYLLLLMIISFYTTTKKTSYAKAVVLS